jgi:hypothetical protein
MDCTDSDVVVRTMTWPSDSPTCGSTDDMLADDMATGGGVEEESPAKMIREHIEDYVLISALSGSITPREDTWIIDSGASKHMTSQRDILSCLLDKKISQKVTLGDDYQYPIKGVGESNYKLNSGTSMKMKDVLYVPGLTKNLLSISALEKKGFRVAFIDGEVLMWVKLVELLLNPAEALWIS